MTKLTSRQPIISQVPSKQDLLDAALPAINILRWISKTTVYRDDSQKSMTGAHNLMEEVLDCMMLVDYVIMASPSPSARELHYDIAVKPLSDAPYLSFKVILRVQP